MCGVPGSGKSTFVKEHLEDSCIHISRDVIRFSKLRDSEDYFSHEDEVFDDFIDFINNEILYGGHDNIYVDATHLNEKARNKVLDKLYLEDVDIYPINFYIPLNICLSRNELRKGDGRAYVPRSVIRRMYNSFQPATHDEKHKYEGILNVFD